jgi:hypothetical protein
MSEGIQGAGSAGSALVWADSACAAERLVAVSTPSEKYEPTVPIDFKRMRYRAT